MPTPKCWLVYYHQTMARNDYADDSPETIGAGGLSSARGLGPSLAISVAGLLVPGASHVILGRRGRGLAFAVAILTMFALGLAMNGRLYDLVPEEPLHMFAFIANAGTGLAYVIARSLGLGIGVLSSPSYEYGTTYLWVAGLLNYLVVLDAFDIAQGRKP